MSLKGISLFLIILLGVSSIGYTGEQGDQMKRENIREEIKKSNWKWISGYAINELTIYSLPFLKRGEVLHKVHGWIYSMSLSPNNNKIAFTVSPTVMASYEELYIMDSNGANLAKLGEFDVGVVSFTSDNKNLILAKYIAEDEFYRNRSVDLYKFNINSKEKKFLCSLKNVNNHTGQLFSPDGSRLLYVDSEKNIMVYDIERQKPVNTGIKGYSPSWSPDGQYIAYQGSDGNCYTMNSDGSRKELLWNTRGFKGKIDLVWSPDSQYVMALRSEMGPIRWFTTGLSVKDASETVYYVISKDSKDVQGLGALR